MTRYSNTPVQRQVLSLILLTHTQAARELAGVSSLIHSLCLNLTVAMQRCLPIFIQLQLLGVIQVAHSLSRYKSYYICTAMRTSSNNNPSDIESCHHLSLWSK